jgi:hypothetical protein
MLTIVSHFSSCKIAGYRISDVRTSIFTYYTSLTIRLVHLFNLFFHLLAFFLVGPGSIPIVFWLFKNSLSV